MKKLKMLSLFSGIGGIDLAAQWAGIETVAFCEIEQFCQKVLKKHWTGVKIYDDVRSINREQLQKDGIRTIDIVAGGFPCQDLSIAGNGVGLVDKNGEATRSGLWYAMLEVIKQTKPKWVIGENVAGMLSNNNGRTFDEILSGLESADYEVITIVSPASNYGATFEGKRVFVIAASKSCGHGGIACQKLRVIARKLVANEFQGDTVWGETERCIVETIRRQETIADDLRSDYGLSDWMDRIKCLGNTVVPQQIYPIFAAIAAIESGDL